LNATPGIQVFYLHYRLIDGRISVGWGMNGTRSAFLLVSQHLGLSTTLCNLILCPGSLYCSVLVIVDFAGYDRALPGC